MYVISTLRGDIPKVKGCKVIDLPEGTYALPIKDALGEIREFTLLDQADTKQYGIYSWSLAGNGYARKKVRHKGKQVTVYLHREIAQPGDGMVVDHINGNRLDNRRSNLRVCTPAENRRNASGMGGKTPFIGVYLPKTNGLWQARIRRGRVVNKLGNFEGMEEAARAYDMAALHLNGDFARLNFPRSDYLFLLS